MKKKGARTTNTTPGVRNGARGRARGHNRKHSAAEFLETPLTMDSPPSQSPESAIFTGSKKRQNMKKTVSADSPAPALFMSPSRPPRTLSSISDLKDLASSRLDDLKRHIDRSHSEILKDIDASSSRLHRRFKIQNQERQKVSDETEKEYKKISERIDKSQEALMTSYAEFMADVQASTSHACTSVTKLSQSFEKSIDALRSRYGI
ncbi:uncharacterized protein LOC21405514 [Morus notabilis]|uniref:uncharacterized protein LOC21405514 n=1 Tax=Morus notabilis TaxID=981085 RepID=UPI000CED0E22|nr:uncharacterized protein LOC21405514 [Morus notabilis]